MKSKELFNRIKENPILTKEDFPESWSVNSVLNPGVGDLDGKTLLFVRVEDREGLSRLVCFSSGNGITDWKIDEETVFTGDESVDGYGVEDPRLTWIDLLKKWVIVYTHYSKGGPLVSIATTNNFKEYSYLGNVLPPDNKDSAIFSEPINGSWWLINRPASTRKEIWIAKSKYTKGQDDLCSWGGHSILIPTDGTPRWDGNHIGLSAPPLKTDYGWLLLYHGVKKTGSSILYRQGLAMLSLEDPTKVTHRSKEFVMGPQEKNDFIGDVAGAIFSCGWRVHESGNSNILRLYYGAADSVICYAEAPLSEVLDLIMKNPI